MGADQGLVRALVTVFVNLSVRTVGDLGAGHGQYTRYFNTHGLNASAYDGWEHRPSWVSQIDLSRPPPATLPRFDAVVSLEVGEHIPSSGAQDYLDTITSHARRVLCLTWAPSGQGGVGLGEALNVGRASFFAFLPKITVGRLSGCPL
jgi:hypothetical protein